jgi:hypothetical protein
MTDRQKATAPASIDVDAVRSAFASVRSSLSRAPAFLVAVAAVAGLSATDAKAWGNNYENLGRVIGTEVAREAAGGGFTPQARVAGLIGQTAGTVIARPLDAKSQEADRLERIRAQAREQAVRDEAYAQARREINPNYQPAAQGSQRVNQGYSAVQNNMQVLVQRNMELTRQYQQRNGTR